MTNLEERPQSFKHWCIPDAKSEHVRAEHLNKVAAQRVNGVHADRRQPELQRGHQVLLQLWIEGADFFRVQLANEGNGLEVLQAQRGELQKLQ